jgi:hypothetical protein
MRIAVVGLEGAAEAARVGETPAVSNDRDGPIATGPVFSRACKPPPAHGLYRLNGGRENAVDSLCGSTQ